MDDLNNLERHGINQPTDIWSDGTTVWIVHGYYTNPGIFAFNLDTKLPDAAKDFRLTGDGGTLEGIPWAMWSDGTTAWVVVALSGGQYRIQAYDLETKARKSSEDFPDIGGSRSWEIGRPYGL